MSGGGGELRAWQVIDALVRLGPVAVFGVASEPAAAPPRDGIEVWRSSSVEGLGVPGGASDLDWLRDPDGHPSDLWYSSVVEDELRATAAAFRPDVIVFDQLLLRRYIELLGALGLPTILNANDVQGALQSDLVDSYERSGRFFDLLRERTSMVEEGAARRVSQIWVCSEDDRRTMERRYAPCAPVAVVPNAVNVDSYPASRAAGPPSVLFPATFGYLPNARAAMFLVEEVFPRLVASLPSVRLTLMGRDPTPWMKEWAAREPRVVVTGPVPDVRPYLASASTMAVPLFVGSGTRLKVLEGFAARLPVISTAVGVAGLAVEPGRHYLAAETVDDFVTEIVRLCGDWTGRAELVGRAHDLVSTRYSSAVVADRVRVAVSELLGEPRDSLHVAD